jgi:hypothetical protein
MSNESRRDDLCNAIAVLTFLIGAATSSAVAMLVISAAALAGMQVFGRRRLMSWPLLAALVAAVTGVAVLTIWR